MSYKQKLLVEGKDDFHVLSNLFDKYSVTESFEIKNEEGDNIFQSIPIYLKADISTIGIVIDADEDIHKKWKKLRKIFSENKYDVPENICKEGVIIKKNELPTIGIWIMPDNNVNGMLEDFMRYLVPQDDLLMSYVEKTLTNLESDNVNKYKSVHQSKAKIHTWLAWQDPPGIPMGLAIKRNIFDTDNELCMKFITWINELFNKG